jgi:hypothetical protein
MGVDIYINDNSDNCCPYYIFLSSSMGAKLYKLFNGSFESAKEKFKEAMKNTDEYKDYELGCICGIMGWILTSCRDGDKIIVSY